MSNLVTEIEGVAPYANLLNAVGVSTINDLSRSQAEELVPALEDMNRALKVVPKSPTAAEVDTWIEQARQSDSLAIAHEELKKRVADIGDIYDLKGWRKLLGSSASPSKQEMNTTIIQVLMVVEQLYVHLAMKRARRGIDYIQLLRLLRHRIENEMEGRYFHGEMLTLLKSFGDIHTAYRLPPPYRQSVAFLPLLIQRSYHLERRNGKTITVPKYYVTNTLWVPSPDLALKPGDEIISWNGVPMSEAVQDHVDFVEGSNPSANVAMALQFMTMRWLGASFQPRAPWIIIGYRTSKGIRKEIRLSWRVLVLKADPNFMTRAQFLWLMLNPIGGGLPIDHALNAQNQIQNISNLVIFRDDKNQKTKKMSENDALHSRMKKMVKAGGRREEMRAFSRSENVLEPGEWSKPHKGLSRQGIPSTLPMFFEAWKLVDSAKPGEAFGHIRIRGFPPMGPPREKFIPEFRRLLALMPADGLLLDIRGNPGGSANLAETALQLLCPRQIGPLTFQFLASRLTQQITRHKDSQYSQWGPSVDMALQTGSMYSSGFPITNPKAANELGQEYFGPVVLGTSASSYSAADIFAAGFQDHEIGPVMGVDSTTGGGGANVWFYRQVLGNDIPITPLAGVPKAQLPQGIDLQFAARRCLRTGKEIGMPIEEIGVVTDAGYRHRLTRDDLIRSDVDFRKHAIRVLSQMPKCHFEISINESSSGLTVTTKTGNIDHLDFYLDDHLAASRKIGVVSGGSLKTSRFRRSRAKISGNQLKILGFRTENGTRKRVVRYKHTLTG